MPLRNIIVNETGLFQNSRPDAAKRKRVVGLGCDPPIVQDDDVDVVRRRRVQDHADHHHLGLLDLASATAGTAAVEKLVKATTTTTMKKTLD